MWLIWRDLHKRHPSLTKRSRFLSGVCDEPTVSDFQNNPNYTSTRPPAKISCFTRTRVRGTKMINDRLPKICNEHAPLSDYDDAQTNKSVPAPSRADSQRNPVTFERFKKGKTMWKRKHSKSVRKYVNRTKSSRAVREAAAGQINFR